MIEINKSYMNLKSLSSSAISNARLVALINEISRFNFKEAFILHRCTIDNSKDVKKRAIALRYSEFVQNCEDAFLDLKKQMDCLNNELHIYLKEEGI